MKIKKWIKRLFNKDRTKLDWKARALIEHRDLREKVSKLYKFVNFDNSFNTLTSKDKRDLSSQLNFMIKYRDILESRISRF